MIDRVPRRLRLAFTGSPADADGPNDGPTTSAHEVDFVAYGLDCVLSGRTVLDGDRLTDMLNDHDEYALIDVTVERFDGGPPIAVPEVVVARNELWLVHATEPRGNSQRRHRTAQQQVAMSIGPYTVRGFYHALPGTDPATAIRRRKPMVPLTGARIAYTIPGEEREIEVGAVIVNRDQVDWIAELEPGRSDEPVGPKRVVAHRS